MTALQHWIASTFTRLAHTLAWPVWGLVVSGLVLVLAGIGLIVYCYLKSLEASD